MMGEGNEHCCSQTALQCKQTERNEDMIKWNIKASAPLIKFSSVSHHDSFLKKIKKGLCVWLEGGNEGCHGTIQGVWGLAEESDENEDHLFCKSLVSASTMLYYILPSPWKISARNTDVIPVHTNTNIFMLITYGIKFYNVYLSLVTINQFFTPGLNFVRHIFTVHGIFRECNPVKGKGLLYNITWCFLWFAIQWDMVHFDGWWLHWWLVVQWLGAKNVCVCVCVYL